MGSFYRKSDKKDDWVFQYLDNGKRHYKVLVGLGDLSKDQRKKYKRKLEVQYEDNKKVRTSVGTQTRRILSTIDVYLEERTKKVKLQTLSQNTLDGDIKRIGYFGDFVKSKFGNISIEDLSDKVLNDYIDYCRDVKDNNKTTIHNNLKVIQGFLKFCERKGWVIVNPYKKIDVPTPNKRTKEDIPNKDEFEKIKLHLYDYIEKYIGGGESFDLIKITSYLQIRLGLRIGEVLIMKWKQGRDDIGEKHSYSYVYLNSTLKKLTIHFKRRLRYLEMNETLQKLFKRIKSDIGSKTYVLENHIKRKDGKKHKQSTGKPFNNSFPSRPFKTMLRSLDIDDKYSTHSLRHGFVTDRWRKGHSLSHIGVVIGHSDTRMTELYGHLDISDVVSVLDDD